PLYSVRNPRTLDPFPTRRSSDLQVDGVELDMGDGVQERGAPLLAAQAAPRQVSRVHQLRPLRAARHADWLRRRSGSGQDDVAARSEEHTSELQSRENLVCRLLLE